MLSNHLSAQDSLIVTYLQTFVDGVKTLTPMETPTIHDTIMYYRVGFKTDTLREIQFTWVDNFNHVRYKTGYLMEESVIWITELTAYAQPIFTNSQYYILSNHRRFLFKNCLVDEDEFEQVRLTSIPRKRKWWQRSDHYILTIEER